MGVVKDVFAAEVEVCVVQGDVGVYYVVVEVDFAGLVAGEFQVIGKFS